MGSKCKTALTCFVMSTSPDATSLNMRGIAVSRRTNPLRTAPNLLTLLRIGLIPFLVVAVIDGRFAAAFVLFIMAASTDAMDGFVARRLGQRTVLGQYLDPAADKLLMSSLFLVLTFVGTLDPRITLIVFGRDLGMSITAAIVYRIADLRDFRPTWLGKANSFSQVAAIGSVLLSLVLPEPWVMATRRAALDTTVLLTIFSGFHYAWVVCQRIGSETESGHNFSLDCRDNHGASTGQIQKVNDPARVQHPVAQIH